MHQLRHKYICLADFADISEKQPNKKIWLVFPWEHGIGMKILLDLVKTWYRDSYNQYKNQLRAFCQKVINLIFYDFLNVKINQFSLVFGRNYINNFISQLFG